MRTLSFEIPTMTKPSRQSAVIESISKLNVLHVATERGRAEVTIEEPVSKADIIRAIEDAGFIVKY